VGDERCICIVFFLILLISDMKWMLMQIMIVFTFLFGLINFSYFIMPSYLIPKWLSIMLSFSFPLCAYWLDDSTHFPQLKCFLNYWILKSMMLLLWVVFVNSINIALMERVSDWLIWTYIPTNICETVWDSLWKQRS